MKKYGIYLAYPPAVDLRAEGLGKHLSEFLKGAQVRGDVQFVIACPSWMHQNLMDLLDASRVARDSFEILSPSKRPLLLSLYEFYTQLKKPKQRKGRLVKLTKLVSSIISSTSLPIVKKLVGARSALTLVLLVIPAFLIFILLALLGFVIRLILMLWSFNVSLLRYIKRKLLLSKKIFGKVSNVTLQPKDSSLVIWLYRLMEESEVSLMHSIIDARKDISAWYCPTAFWPHFNQISAPRLMCVPDVVLANFPVGFSNIGGQRFLENFNQVEQAIALGQHFVTYSEDVKWQTLVERYHVSPNAVEVVAHGANKLDHLVVVKGFADNEVATDALCRNLFKQSLNKLVRVKSENTFVSEDVKFIFYASQFRPNKNLITLLRAYEYLLKKRYIGHKLILTGNPFALPEVADFIQKHHLENDVLCLTGLSLQELAACYRLADLAVNPSLSEGGCPFTFTEALSVNTPVVMAKIAVTEELITDVALQLDMLFDPYDWKDMASKIEWALSNSDALLTQQKILYQHFSNRTWTHVVNDYVRILDKISLIS